MGIVFFCQSCGARFEVGAQMAGKKGRCKKCGQLSTIPKAEELASMVAMPALSAAAVGGGGGGGGAARGNAGRMEVAGGVAVAERPAGVSWLKNAVSSVGLAPLTINQMPAIRRGSAPSALDDAEDSKPYMVAPPTREEARRYSSGRPNVVVSAWRGQIGGLQKVFRWLNQSAYLVSVPFIMILLAGIVVKSRPVALFAATVVVLLNVGRLVAGVANLAMVPLRDGLNTKRMKKPIGRIVEPIVTVALVLLAFTFIPWLASDKGAASTGNIAERLKASAKGLKAEMKGEISSIEATNLQDLGAKVKAEIKDLAKPPTDGAPAQAAPKGAGAPPSADAAVQGIIGDVTKRVRETIKESQSQP